MAVYRQNDDGSLELVEPDFPETEIPAEASEVSAPETEESEENS